MTVTSGLPIVATDSKRLSHERNVIMSSQPHGGIPSLVVITLDVLVTWALTAHGRELRTH